MSRAISLVVVLIFSCFYSHGVAAQTSVQKTPPLTSLKPNSPTTSPSVPGTVAVPHKVEAKKLYEAGLKLTEAGQLTPAIENFQQALRLDGEYAEAYAGLGRAYFKMRQWQKAIDNLNRAAELNTKQKEAQDALHKKLTAQNIEREKPVGNSAAPATQQTLATKPAANSALLRPKNEGPSEIVRPPVKQSLPSAVPPSSKVESSGPKNSEVTSRTSTSPQTQLATKQIANSGSANRMVESRNQPQKPSPEVKQEIVSLAPQLSTEPANSQNTNASISKQVPKAEPVSMSATPTSQPMTTNTVTPTPSKPMEVALTKIYKIGPSDVLDIRVDGAQSTGSTLFTVTSSGLIEHPLLPDPLQVAGLSVDELGTSFENELAKRSVVENPKVSVAVRDYASHSILVSGLVKDSGTKFLRREAIPLYVVVADAQPLPEAAKVTLIRNEQNQVFEVDLTQAADMNLLVRPGDVITLLPFVTQFVYIGGEVRFPGEKTFRRGLTLTQAMISSGVNPKAKLAQIGRDDGRGFVVETQINLKEIKLGKAADPLLKPGDRILIMR